MNAALGQLFQQFQYLASRGKGYLSVGTILG
jgi:hypothetical protein